MINRAGIFLFMILLWVGSAHARGGGDWQDVGNGGDVVLCPSWISLDDMVTSDDVMTSFELAEPHKVYALDYLEAVERWKIIPLIPNQLKDAESIALALLDRLPNGYEFLRELSKLTVMSMPTESRFFTDDLPDARDEGLAVFPSDCSLHQLVLQKPTRNNGEAYYTFDGRLWRLMDESQRAVMMVHEALYRHSLLAKKEYSSENIRYVVAWLIGDLFNSKDFDNSTNSNNVMKAAGFRRE